MRSILDNRSAIQWFTGEELQEFAGDRLTSLTNFLDRPFWNKRMRLYGARELSGLVSVDALSEKTRGIRLIRETTLESFVQNLKERSYFLNKRSHLIFYYQDTAFSHVSR